MMPSYYRVLVAIALFLLIACQTDAQRIREANETAQEIQQIGPTSIPIAITDSSPTPRTASATPTATPIPELTADINVFDIKVGDCINYGSLPSSDIDFASVEIVPCAENWEYRVVDSFIVESGDTYPGQTYFEHEGAKRCDRRYTLIIRPTRDSWDLGDRLITCLQESYGLATSDPEKLDLIVKSRFLKEGECFNENSLYIELVSCSETWQFRVLNIFEVRLEGLYPEINYFNQQAHNFCDRHFSQYIYPVKKTWSEGDRQIICLQDSYGLSVSDPEKLERIVDERSLAAGECFNEVPDYVELVSCSGDWDYKILTAFTVEAISQYPGKEYFAQQAEIQCDPRYELFQYPFQESWNTGYRTVLCLQTR